LLSKEDNTQILEHFAPLIKQGYMNRYNIWKIKKRNEDDDFGSEIELSE